MPRLALVILLVALVAAGCTSGPTTNGTPGNVTTGASGTTYTPEQARALLAGAASDFPPQFGFEMTLKNGSVQVISMKGLFDNTTKVSYVDMKMNASALGAEAEGAGGAMGGSAALFAGGITIYATPKASVWIMNNTAFTIPPDAGNESKGMLGGADPTASLKDLSDPHKLFANFSGSGDKSNDTTIKSITPTIYKGKPAVSIVGATTKNGTSYEATIVLYTNPTRPAHVEGQFPPENGKASDPLSKGTVTMDFYYGTEVTTKVPAKAERALGLAYKSDSNAMSMSGDSSATNSTWTFLVSGGVPANDIVLEVKDASSSRDGSSPSSPASIGDMPTLWSMKLSDATATKDGVTLAFNDADHDGKISAGDTVTTSWTSDAGRPSVILKDSVSGLYIVPGAGPLALFAALGAVAVLARRRR